MPLTLMVLMSEEFGPFITEVSTYIFQDIEKLNKDLKEARETSGLTAVPCQLAMTHSYLKKI